jgi:oligopeptide transport system substrate-binding protein
VAARLTRTATRRSRGFATVAALAVLAAVALAGHPAAAGAARDDVRVLLAAPLSVDPAAQGDIESASVAAQLYESLTAFDPSLTLRPALAKSWDVERDGRRIVFHLRDGLGFSDGSPLTGADVVRSWLRLLDPNAPSPLVSLALGIEGASDYLAGRADADGVGLHADGLDVTVDLVRPAGDFPAIVAGPSFAVVPRSMSRDERLAVAGFAGSGAYVLSAINDNEVTLTRNDRYWAGPAPVKTVHLVQDLGGRGGIDAFGDGDLDYVGIGDFEASWVRYDEVLGPQLRTVPSLAVSYLGFDTSRPPFDNALVRRAFGEAVNWRRVVALGSGADMAATGMVPPGIPGRSDTDYLPAFDPVSARKALADAGYPGGAGFPSVTLVDPAAGVARAVQSEVKRELGIDVAVETMEFEQFFSRLSADPPPMWVLTWVADYPGQNDFLRVLLGTGQSNNYGRWSSADFDRAVDEAEETTDPTAASAAFDRAQQLVKRDVPAIPLSYSPGWALSRDKLLGAGQNGMGILRLASLAWQP